MSDRYFASERITTEHVILTGTEAHHLIHVMRAKPELRVTLFDGSGGEFDAVVRRVGRSEVELAVLGRREVDRELPLTLTLGVALPKGERQRWLVEKAVELGVGCLVPLETARGVAQPVENALERLRRAVIEASKQCGRNRLMEIAEPRGWDAFLTDTAGVACRLLAHPGPSGADIRPRPGEPVAIGIGPEGGFTDDEVARATAAGWQPVSLGPRILRVETAAIFLAALVAARM